MYKYSSKLHQKLSEIHNIHENNWNWFQFIFVIKAQLIVILDGNIFTTDAYFKIMFWYVQKAYRKNITFQLRYVFANLLDFSPTHTYVRAIFNRFFLLIHSVTALIIHAFFIQSVKTLIIMISHSIRNNININMYIVYTRNVWLRHSACHLEVFLKFKSNWKMILNFKILNHFSIWQKWLRILKFRIIPQYKRNDSEFKSNSELFLKMSAENQSPFSNAM